MKKLMPILLALMCACGTEEPPPPQEPHILSIAPTEQNINESKRVTVTLDVEPHFIVNYTTGSVVMREQPVLEIGPQTVPLDRYLGHGQFQGTVNPGLELGSYDIRVMLGDGREAFLPNAYAVTFAPTVGYDLDPINEVQYLNEPFTITIHAVVSSPELFKGSVTVTVYKVDNGISVAYSFRSGPFSNGSRQEQISIDTLGNYLITVQGDDGNSATSRTFSVVERTN